MSALGQKPSFYPETLGWLVTANSGPSFNIGWTTDDLQ